MSSKNTDVKNTKDCRPWPWFIVCQPCFLDVLSKLCFQFQIPKWTDKVNDASYVVTGAIRIYYWYMDAKLSTDTCDSIVHK